MYAYSVTTIDIKKVDKQFTHAMHVKYRHVNDTFIDKLTTWYQCFDWILVILYMSNIKTVGFSSK